MNVATLNCIDCLQSLLARNHQDSDGLGISSQVIAVKVFPLSVYVV